MCFSLETECAQAGMIVRTTAKRPGTAKAAMKGKLKIALGDCEPDPLPVNLRLIRPAFHHFLMLASNASSTGCHCSCWALIKILTSDGDIGST